MGQGAAFSSYIAELFWGDCYEHAATRRGAHDQFSSLMKKMKILGTTHRKPS